MIMKETDTGFSAYSVDHPWRIIFIWDGGNAYEVQIRDYHK